MRKEFYCQKTNETIIVENKYDLHPVSPDELANTLLTLDNSNIREAIRIVGNKNKNRLIAITKSCHGAMYQILQNHLI